MTFAIATNKGNMSTSRWISATGIIGPDTPVRFRALLDSEQYLPGQIILNSSGGNLLAGLELGRMIREAGLTAHIGTTDRKSSDASCTSWEDSVEAGICASACAYAFLGGQDRFVDSPYYPTGPNLLGFHQFYGSPERGGGLLTAKQLSEIEASSLSAAQAVAGQIVLYAIEMDIDPRVVAFAFATPSDDLYIPTEAELVDLSITSGSGLQPWAMEPYGNGLLTVTKPYRSDSMLDQITAFCHRNDGKAQFLLTMEMRSSSYPQAGDLPIFSVELTIDGDLHSIDRRDLSVRYWDDSVLVSVPVQTIEPQLLLAEHV